MVPQLDPWGLESEDSGRSCWTTTAIGMVAGSRSSEHEYLGDATVQALRGRVRLTTGEVLWEGRPAPVEGRELALTASEPAHLRRHSVGGTATQGGLTTR